MIIHALILYIHALLLYYAECGTASEDSVGLRPVQNVQCTCWQESIEEITLFLYYGRPIDSQALSVAST